MTFLKKLISTNTPKQPTQNWHTQLQNEFEKIATEIQTSPGTFPASLAQTPALLFASMTPLTKPNSTFRKWLETVAIHREATLNQFVKDATTTFWETSLFQDTHWASPLDLNPDNATPLDFALIAVLCHKIDIPTFEAIKQVYYAKCEFESDKSVITYYEKDPDTTPVHHSYYTYDDTDVPAGTTQTIETVTESRLIMLCHELTQHFINSKCYFELNTNITHTLDTSPSELSARHLLATQLHAILSELPTQHKFIVSAQTKTLSPHHNYWFTGITGDGYVPTTQYLQTNNQHTLYIPSIEILTAANSFFLSGPIQPRSVLGRISSDRLRWLGALGIRPVFSPHYHIKNNPSSPHGQAAGPYLGAAHDFAFHSTQSARLPRDIQNMITLYLCDTLHSAADRIQSSNVNHKTKIWTKYILNDLTEAANDHFLTANVHTDSDTFLKDSLTTYFHHAIREFSHTQFPTEFTHACLCLGLEVAEILNSHMEAGYPTSTSLCNDTVTYSESLNDTIALYVEASFHEFIPTTIQFLIQLNAICIDTFQEKEPTSSHMFKTILNSRYFVSHSELQAFKRVLYTVSSDAAFQELA